MADSRETTGDITKPASHETAELSIQQSNKRIGTGSDPGSTGRRLDVDAVLERSVRKAISE